MPSSIFSPEEIDLRRQVADRYAALLGSHSHIQVPSIPQGSLSAWAQYSILATDEQQRTEIQHNLKEAGIPTAIYYPKPLHMQSAFSSLGYKKGDFPVSEDCAQRIFSLPMHPYLMEEDQKKIADVIGDSDK